MANGRKRITNTSSTSTEKKRQRLQAKFSEYKHPEFDSDFCWNAFIVAQLEKGNSKQTIKFYKCIGKYVYTVENNEFGNFRIINRRKIK